MIDPAHQRGLALAHLHHAQTEIAATMRTLARLEPAVNLPRADVTPSRPSPREMDVLTLAAQGLTRDAIGRQLNLSVATVKRHLQSALDRTGAKNTTHLVAIAFQEGWLT